MPFRYFPAVLFGVVLLVIDGALPSDVQACWLRHCCCRRSSHQAVTTSYAPVAYVPTTQVPSGAQSMGISDIANLVSLIRVIREGSAGGVTDSGSTGRGSTGGRDWDKLGRRLDDVEAASKNNQRQITELVESQDEIANVINTRLNKLDGRISKLHSITGESKEDDDKDEDKPDEAVSNDSKRNVLEDEIEKIEEEIFRLGLVNMQLRKKNEKVPDDNVEAFDKKLEERAKKRQELASL